MLPRNPTRTAQTKADYLREGYRHLRRARRRYPLITCPASALLVMLREDAGVLMPATVRRYLQELTACLDALIWKGAVALDRCQEIVDEFRMLLEKRQGRPDDPRTSACKVRNATREECDAVYKALIRPGPGRTANQLDQTVAMILHLGPRLGFRPVELKGATIVGRYLVLPCAKATNGRAPAKERKIDLSPFPKKVRILVRALLAALPSALERYGTWKRLHKALSERLARACRRVAVRRLCFYAFRHVAIATWKAAGLDRAVIAALAGQKSAETASRHYASGKHGWKVEHGLAGADPELVAAIRQIWSRPPLPPVPEPEESTGMGAFRI